MPHEHAETLGYITISQMYDLLDEYEQKYKTSIIPTGSQREGITQE